jgi:phosphatidylinositol 4-phosphatase
MKKFISRASRTFTNLPQLPPLANLNLGGTGIRQSSPTSNTNPSGIQPKFLIPPVPHPSPHAYLAVLVTDDGLLMRPHVPGDARGPSSYIRIRWQKNVKVEELQMNADQEDIDWIGAAIVYGVVGVLELFNSGWSL